MNRTQRLVDSIVTKLLPRTKASARTCFYQSTTCSNTACPTRGSRGTHVYRCCDVAGDGTLSNCSTQTSATCCGA